MALDVTPDVHLTPDAPFADERFSPVVDAFKALFRRRRDGGGAIAVYWQGEPVVDIWAGYADVGAREPWQADTMSMSFSTTKGITATVVHRLLERDVLALDEPVATWWPEFGQHGKDDILLSELLTHHAGLSRIRGLLDVPGDLIDHQRVAAMLAARKTSGRLRGVPAYHGLTYGWLVGTVVERATGLPFGEVVQREIVEPLGLDGMYVSTPSSQHHRVATLFPGIYPLGLNGDQLAATMGRVPRLRPFVDALLPSGFEKMVNTPALLSTTMPAANGVVTARSLARMYGALAAEGFVDGIRFLEPKTVLAAGKVQTKDRDRVLGFRMRWRLGYHQGFVADAPQPRMAFGHFGFGGSGAWADPETGLAMAFTTNRLGSITTPVADARLARLGGLALTCVRGEA